MRTTSALAAVLAGCVFASAAAAAAGAARGSAGSPPDARKLLASVVALTEAEWATIERGEPLVRVLETSSREIAVAGAIRISGSRDALVAHLRNVAALEGSGIVLAVGRIAGQPSASDLQALAFDDHNLFLRDCQPGDCRVRLSSPEIARFQRGVDWDASDWRDRSAAVWRDVLAARVRAYTAEGIRALADYVNKNEPLSVRSEVAALVREFPFVESYSPEMYQYLHDLGPAVPPGIEPALYWTREDFGIRTVLRIKHQLVQRTGKTPVSLVATSQVYADHYLDAALGVSLALDAPGGCYMIAIDRARTRSLGGLLRRLARSTVQNRSREAMRVVLTRARAAVAASGSR